MIAMTKPSLVVCVEDDEPVRDALRGLLRASGINAASFASAEEFLDSDELQTATCLVTDIQLGGISGLDLLDRLAGMSVVIPSILITAHTDVAAGDRARSSGAMKVFLKPVSPSELLQAIRTALANAS
ncbi:response regulator [Rhizobium lentis]|jgi:FixJ family two-component response regulator|uniref:response regulator transcription factor n=1 Tax=Rhizobium TaxID=379 RepID=UPI000DDF8316|nr:MULTISPECIES: response regulator [Rhizobium]MBB3320151.1 FixJ family two-component response regulator [Rhizobium sp. BK181]MBB3544889.1 FixJ family two-component response regulator [Rhizobium sp. BK399]MBX5135569.1 response regulator [Rhizobium lentis]MBX5141529.1 response regulator [Rhizobium lentis]MBX5153688.1 response regulator [Rhizobium lentis]